MNRIVVTSGRTVRDIVENENDTVLAGCDLRQDDAGLGVVLVFHELYAQEIQEPARECAARASV